MVAKCLLFLGLGLAHSATTRDSVELYSHQVNMKALYANERVYKNYLVSKVNKLDRIKELLAEKWKWCMAFSYPVNEQIDTDGNDIRLLCSSIDMEYGELLMDYMALEEFNVGED